MAPYDKHAFQKAAAILEELRTIPQITFARGYARIIHQRRHEGDAHDSLDVLVMYEHTRLNVAANLEN